MDHTMASTNLTTEDPWSSFQADLVKQTQKMAYVAEVLGKQHSAARDPYKSRNGFGGSYGKYMEVPDTPALFTGFTMLVAQLRMIINRIQDLEDIANSYEEEDEDGALDHSQGELFAYKEMYINIINSYEAVEDVRVKGTEQGVPLNTFMRAVCEDGVPKLTAKSKREWDHLLVDGRITSQKFSYNHPTPATFKLPAATNLMPNPSLQP